MAGLKTVPSAADVQRELKARLSLVHSLLKDRSGEIAKADVYKGKAGVALFFHHHGKTFKHTSSSNLARKLIKSAIHESLSEEPDLSLYAGIPGILWSAKKILGSDKEVNALLPRGFRQQLLLRMAGHLRYAGFHELAHGASGWWVFSESVPRSEWFRETVLEYLRKTRNFDGKEWWSTSGEIGLGIAHGICAPLLLRNSTTDARRLRRFLKPLSESPLPPLYPKNIKKTHVQSAWCYGDAGAGFSLTRLSQSVGDKSLQKDAKKIFRRGILPGPHYEPIDNPFICHGYSGQALLALRFWKLTGEAEDKAAIDLWKKKLLTIAPEDFRTITTVGLHDGLSGIGLALLALLEEKPSDWDRLLMLS